MALLTTDRFGFATVMKPKFFTMTQDVNSDTPVLTLDSLRISNITQEGPTKTTRGGLYGETMLKYGKTMRLEMEDVIGRVDALQLLSGATFSSTPSVPETKYFAYQTSGASDKTITLGVVPLAITSVKLNYTGTTTAFTLVLDSTLGYSIADNVITVASGVTVALGDSINVIYTVETSAGHLQITDSFAQPFQIVGETFIIDTAGNKRWINLIIHKFLPDSTFNQTMELEGDFAVTTFAGDILPNACGVYYEYFEVTAPSCN